MDQVSSKAIAEALHEWASSPIAVSDPILPVGSPPAVALAVLACYSHRIHSQEGKITVCVHVCCVLVLIISYRLFASASCVGCATGPSPAQAAADSLKRPAAALDGGKVAASAASSASADSVASSMDSSDEETMRQEIALAEMKLHLRKKMKAAGAALTV